jgi:peptide/nickel transport system substrate-binding protein
MHNLIPAEGTKMRLTRLRLLLPALLVAGLANALSSCGGGGSTSGSAESGIPSDFKAPTAAPDNAQKGGTLTELNGGDIDHMDPGAAYYQVTYSLTLATQRSLMGWPPDATQPVPDLAGGQPKVTDGGKTITFAIRPGVHYSPPVDRAVKAQDVKYAIERTLLPGVPNGYARTYLDGVVGFQQAENQVKADRLTAPNISGITTPDDHTLVIKLTNTSAAPVIQALSLPMSVPVPEEYAKKFDARSPSGYEQHVTFTGPYMVQNDCDVKVDSSTHVAKAQNSKCTGKLTGYQPGKEIQMIRNPNWTGSKEGDYRPAYLDGIDIQEGFSDPTSASQKILSGNGQVNGDFPPSKTVVQQVATGSKYSKDQMVAVPSGGNRYIALNMTKPPFGPGNGLSAAQAADVRKAVIANSDRTALRNTRGGELFGPVATHFIPPLIPGFDEAGGLQGPNLDFIKNPNGDPSLAKSYMQKAGFKSGKCEGSVCDVTMVGDDAPPGKDTATVFQHQLEQLGFTVNFQPAANDIMITKFCAVPANQPQVCPNAGWIKDFNDPQSILQVPFSGESINPSNNPNWPQLNDPAINKAIADAVTIQDPKQRAETWGKIDDQIMAQAPAVPFVWDYDVLVRSTDVNGVANLFNGEWDLAYTSLTNP